MMLLRIFLACIGFYRLKDLKETVLLIRKNACLVDEVVHRISFESSKPGHLWVGLFAPPETSLILSSFFGCHFTWVCLFLKQLPLLLFNVLLLFQIKQTHNVGDDLSAIFLELHL